MTEAAGSLWLLSATCLAIVHAWKCAEIGYDVLWVVRAGATYQRDALEQLLRTGTVSLDALDKKHRRKQPLWQLASRWPTFLRTAVGLVFRVPTLIILQTVLLVLTPSPVTSFERLALVSTSTVLLCGIAISVFKEFIHRIHFGWFYPYRRDMNFQPAGERTLRAEEVDDDGMIGRLLRLLALLVVLIIVGFGSIYFALELAYPGTFEIGATNSTWLGCIYLSAVTMATVGYGDVKPAGDLGRVVVITQIVLGPFVLTMLILALSAGLAAPRVQGGSGNGAS